MLISEHVLEGRGSIGNVSGNKVVNKVVGGCGIPPSLPPPQTHRHLQKSALCQHSLPNLLTVCSAPMLSCGHAPSIQASIPGLLPQQSHTSLANTACPITTLFCVSVSSKWPALVPRAEGPLPPVYNLLVPHAPPQVLLQFSATASLANRWSDST